MSTVVLVRNGETTWNREERVQGWAPASLTDRGHQQASRVGAAIADRYDPDRLVASDLQRAVTTAEYVSDATGLCVNTERGWRERDFGRLQGIAMETLHEEFAEFSLAARGRAAVEKRPDGGESAAEMRDRIRELWTDLIADLGTDETAVVVCHAGPIHVVTATVRGNDLAPVMGQQENGALTEVAVGDDETRLVRQNEVRHR